MSHFCQYYPVNKTGGQNMYHILEGNDLQFYIFVRLCLVIRGSLAHGVYFCPRGLKAGARLIRNHKFLLMAPCSYDRLSKKEKHKILIIINEGWQH